MRSDHPSIRGGRLTTSVVAGDDGSRTIHVGGAVDHEAARELQHIVRSTLATATPGPALVVDLDAAWPVAPLAGLAVLLDAARRTRARGVLLHVAHCPEALSQAMVETDVGPTGPAVTRGGNALTVA